MDKKGISDWMYLAVSAIVSYWLIAEQRGDDKHWDITVAHNARKIVWRMRMWLVTVDNRLQSYIDKELDKERTV